MSLKANLNRQVLLFVVDTALFFLALFLALLIRRPDIFELSYFIAHMPRFFLLYVYFILGLFIGGFYEIPHLSLKIRRLKYIMYITGSYVLFGMSYFYILPSEFSPKTVLLMQSLMLITFVGIWRFYSDALLKSTRKVKAVMLDKSVDAEELIKELFKNDHGVEVLHHIDPSTLSAEQESLNKLSELLHKSRVEIIIADIKNKSLEPILPHIYTLTGTGVKLYDLKNMYQYVFKKMSLGSVGYFWFYENISLDTKVYEFVKRVLDLLLCVPVFIMWVVIHPWTAYKIKKEDGGEVYSVQERLGRYNKVIFIKKYRTMSYTDKGIWQEGSQNKITTIGRFLRRTRIDELPQILSVWKGDLSFIGPRTDIINLGERLSSEVPYYNLRYSVTPGLSGWAQTNMNFQPRTIEDTIERLKYDLYYVKNRSMFLDVVIVLRTVKTLLSREGS